jgi:hypothetical protein
MATEASDPAERQANVLGARIAAELGSAGSATAGPLSDSIRGVAERHLGLSLAGTTLRSGADGHARAVQENALAVTDGSVVSFRDGALSTATPEGRQLLGHELTHVAQQRAARTSAVQRFSLDDVVGGLTGAVSAAGSVALAGARALASALGGSISITPTGGIIIEIPDVDLFDDLNDEEEGPIIPLGAIPLAPPIPIGPALGLVGLLAYAQPSVAVAVGPGRLRDIRIVIDPLSSHYGASAQLYVAGALGVRVSLFGGLVGLVATAIPTVPPIPIVISLEAGLRGTATGWNISALQSTASLDYRSGTLSFASVNDLMLGILIQGDLDLFAALRIETRDVCHYAYRLAHWEGGRAKRITVPITAGYGPGGGTGSIGPITVSPIPIEDIETVIRELPRGWQCMKLEQIIEWLCKEKKLPPILCEDPSAAAKEQFCCKLKKRSTGGEEPPPHCPRFVCGCGDTRGEAQKNAKNTAPAECRKFYAHADCRERFKDCPPKCAQKCAGANAADGPDDPSPSTACPVPINYRQDSASSSGENLVFGYKWDSSTGNLADLSNCEVGEHVAYPGSNPYVWPKPPWDGSTPNPTIIWLGASRGALVDTHSTKPFVKPYRNARFTATQHYRYRTSCANGGNPVNLMGPIPITRTVSQKPDGTYKYEITKSGQTAKKDPLPP